MGSLYILIFCDPKTAQKCLKNIDRHIILLPYILRENVGGVLLECYCGNLCAVGMYVFILYFCLHGISYRSTASIIIKVYIINLHFVCENRVENSFLKLCSQNTPFLPSIISIRL